MPVPTVTSMKTWFREHLSAVVWGTCIAVAVGSMALAWSLLEPPCPTEIEIATGSADGQYHAVASRYQEILADNGVTLTIRTTQGSVENGQLLRDGDISLAIMQAGAVPPPDEGEPKLQSLAGLYLEPLWVFCRSEAFHGEDVTRLEQLRGKRIAVGSPGSGTRALAEMLLKENDMQHSAGEPSQVRAIGGAAAAKALQSGEVDAAFFVISPEAPLIQSLMQDETLQLLSFDRAQAYAKRHRYLTPVTLHEGIIDLDANIPGRDIQLLAPTACLVAGENLHPALAPLLLEAAAEVHQRGGYLETAGQFPSPHQVDFPLSDEARRYFSRGPSVFYRYLPFRWAAWADRVKMMLLPLITLLLPLLQFAPPIYNWSVRSKIYCWYEKLCEIDRRMFAGESDLTADLTSLQKIEAELIHVRVPLSYMEEYYTLREHLVFLSEQLEDRLGRGVERPAVRRAA